MDSRLIKKGATVYFPVRVPGALLAMGDIHATMGEMCIRDRLGAVPSDEQMGDLSGEKEENGCGKNR